MRTHYHLILAWLWVFLGFVSGMVLGLFFHDENWLGGYGSFKRRLYRLAHISFFGLGAANLLFYFTAQTFPAGSLAAAIASGTFVVGAISMPLCCVLMANFPKTRMLFAVPVISLVLGGALTLALVVQPPAQTGGTACGSPALSHQLSTPNKPSTSNFP